MQMKDKRNVDPLLSGTMGWSWAKMKSLQDEQTHLILSGSDLPLKYNPGHISKQHSPCQTSVATALPAAWQLYHLPPSCSSHSSSGAWGVQGDG